MGSHGLERELRGAGHNEWYRYDTSSGGVMCVSCGEGVAPAQGEALDAQSKTTLPLGYSVPAFTPMPADGQRVFFQTTAQLVPQDTNSTETNISSAGGTSGMDVYEWEAFGVEEEPGVVCRVLVGCTHLISAGDATGPSYLLGASEDGRDVFFSSASPLVAWATPEFSNIYDARVDGGFPPPPAHAVECTSCQGVGGGPVPQIGAPASVTFLGAGNPPIPSLTSSSGSKSKSKPKSTSKPSCGRGFERRGGRCVRVSSRRRNRRRAVR